MGKDKEQVKKGRTEAKAYDDASNVYSMEITGTGRGTEDETRREFLIAL